MFIIFCRDIANGRIIKQVARSMESGFVYGKGASVIIKHVVITWMGDHQGSLGTACEPGFVRRCGLKSVTNRLYSRYRAET